MTKPISMILLPRNSRDLGWVRWVRWVQSPKSAAGELPPSPGSRRRRWALARRSIGGWSRLASPLGWVVVEVLIHDGHISSEFIEFELIDPWKLLGTFGKIWEHNDKEYDIMTVHWELERNTYLQKKTNMTSFWMNMPSQSLFALDLGNPPARRLFCGAFAPSKLSRRTDGIRCSTAHRLRGQQCVDGFMGRTKTAHVALVKFHPDM